MYNSQEIANRIKSRAKLQGRALGEMLSACELGVNTVSKIGKGTDILTLNFAKIADYLDCPVDYLLGRGVFANWERIMEKNNLAKVISHIELLFPGFQKYDLLHAEEKELMKILPAFISQIEISEDTQEIEVIYTF